MATDKAAIVWQGETLAARSARVLAHVCAPVIEVGAGVSGLPCVREDPPRSGPLAALVAGAGALDARSVVLLACDLPFVEAPVLELLATWPGQETVIPIAGGRLQYVCARYGAEALAHAADALAAGESALRILASVPHDEVDEAAWNAIAPAGTFADVDTPEDLRRLGLS
jgi:molybdopterin-guanine dinucleotide biosynthesis protein A